MKNLFLTISVFIFLFCGAEKGFADRLGNCPQSQEKAFSSPKTRKLLLGVAENIAKLYKFKTSFKFDENLYCNVYKTPSVLGGPRFLAMSLTPEPKTEKNNRAIDTLLVHSNCINFIIVDTTVSNTETFLNKIWNIKGNKYYDNPGLTGWNKICA